MDFGNLAQDLSKQINTQQNTVGGLQELLNSLPAADRNHVMAAIQQQANPTSATPEEQPQQQPATTEEATSTQPPVNDTSSTTETSSEKPNTAQFNNGDAVDKYTADYKGVNMNEADRLANETILNQIRYGQPIEKMRMTDETVEGMNYSRGLRQKAANQDLLGSKLSTMANIKDAARYTGQAAAAGAAGQAAMAGGDVASDKIASGKIASAVSPVYGQMAQQLAGVEQQYQQNQFARNQLEGANNTDMVSHSNTREYIEKDNPLKPLIDKLAMQQAAMNYLANKKALGSEQWSQYVTGKANKQEGAGG